ncbi:hypothetical protein yc1106_06403 [Curvularia clavata]|uniref:Uncharacterized protein n=1 Tax=Curvularia clavata TaxID=95742 RepID=A0A9Q8ZCV9_CURCL|nr:hypothetical protein yc1106_06403 [Curvularia clavata]
MTSRQLHGISGDESQDDEDDALPGYEEASSLPLPVVPDYDDEGNGNSNNIAYTGRCVRYKLWQCDRRTQTLEVLEQDDHDDARACPTYHITTNSRFRISLSSSSKKPDLEVLQTLPGSQVICMAGIWFDNGGGFPWRPRAHFECTGDDGLSSQYHMEAERFADWRVSMGGGRTLVWRLQRGPVVALVLGEMEDSHDDTAVARFTFSSLGMRARKGEEVGVLEMFDNGLIGLGREGRDRVVCGIAVVMSFFRRMGKLYSNGRGGG